MNAPERTEVVNGIRYDTKTATLLATDNSGYLIRQGQNTYLFRGKDNRFFVAYLTEWQGELDYIKGMEPEEAQSLYHILPYKKVDFEKSFTDIKADKSGDIMAAISPHTEADPIEARRNKGKGVGAAFGVLIGCWAIGSFLIIVIPWLPFYIFFGAGVLGFLIQLSQASNYFVGECPYCGHETEGVAPVFACKHCKNKITVKNEHFRRLKTN